MSEASERALIVAEARKWIGTPYHSCGDIRGVGIDCGMLIVRCFVDTKLCAPFDPRPYPPDWHLHHSEEKYLKFVTDRCGEVTTPQPGDVMVFRWGRCYSHGGIVSAVEPVTIVHAFQPWRKVVEMPVAQDVHLNQPKREPKFFSLWNKQQSAG